MADEITIEKLATELTKPEVKPEAKPQENPKNNVMQEHHVDFSKLVESATTADAMLNSIVQMKEDDFIPWEEIALPSVGFYYDGKIPGGVVRVRAMGIHAEKILATSRLAQTGQSIDYLFKHCVQLPDNFDQSELLIGDRIFLLYVLRGITHGNKYEFSLKCPHCDTTSAHMYDLNELASTIKGPDMANGPEPFKVPLPYMSDATHKKLWVKVRLMRGKDISAITNRMKFNKRVNKTQTVGRDIAIDQAVVENLSLCVEAFGGDGIVGEVTDQFKLKMLVERFHSKDSSSIREFLRNAGPGIDTQIVVACPECGQEIKTELPITEGFFRPTSEGKS